MSILISKAPEAIVIGSRFVSGGTATASGNGVLTTFNIPHGIGNTPVLRTAVADSLDAVGNYMVSADTVNVIITYTIAPPGGTNNLRWNWMAGFIGEPAVGFTPTSAVALENKTIDASLNTLKFPNSTLKVRNPADTFDYIVASSAITSNRTVTLPLLTTNDTFMMQAFPMNITGLKRFQDNTLSVLNPATTFQYFFRSSALAANRNVTLPLLTGDDTLVFQAFAQPLTNKALGAGTSVADGQDIALGTTTGTKIATATTQKLGFFNKTPVVQPAAVADATDAGTAITQLNLLLARMRDLGLVAP